MYLMSLSAGTFNIMQLNVSMFFASGAETETWITNSWLRKFTRELFSMCSKYKKRLFHDKMLKCFWWNIWGDFPPLSPLFTWVTSSVRSSLISITHPNVVVLLHSLSPHEQHKAVTKRRNEDKWMTETESSVCTKTRSFISLGLYIYSSLSFC